MCFGFYVGVVVCVVCLFLCFVFVLLGSGGFEFGKFGVVCLVRWLCVLCLVWFVGLVSPTE
jgi:hypothetical protein